MMLRWKVLVGGLVLALPVAALAWVSLDRVRERDQRTAIGRVVLALLNDQMRERCESDPRWFFTGPLEGRPPAGVFLGPDPEVLGPRPRAVEQPFELFAYDEQFLGSSPATPRFPQEFRGVMRTTATEAYGTYITDEGTGVQMVVSTGWLGGPCTYLLGRLAPLPDRRGEGVRFLLGGFLVALVVGLASAAPIVARVRRLARDARASAGSGYPTIAPDRHKDELSAVAFAFNDAATEVRTRKARIDAVETALRRFVQSTDEDLADPLRQLEARLGAAAVRAPEDEARTAIGPLLSEAHDLSARFENLVVAARLRMRQAAEAPVPVDLRDLVARVIDRHRPFAAAAGVSLDVVSSADGVVVQGQPREIECAVANVIDNAIRYNTPGGRVAVSLDRRVADRRFSLTIADTGRGVSEADLKALTAIHRFRGDEGRHRRAGGPGLGLAVTREVADRSGLQFELRCREAGGLEAEFSGPV